MTVAGRSDHGSAAFLGILVWRYIAQKAPEGEGRAPASTCFPAMN